MKSLEEIKVFLSEHTSEETAVSMKHLAAFVGVKERWLRVIVAEWREVNPFGEQFLVSNHKAGYWLTSDAKEIEAFFDGYLSAAYSIIETVKCNANLLSPEKVKEICGRLNIGCYQNEPVSKSHKAKEPANRYSQGSIF